MGAEGVRDVMLPRRGVHCGAGALLLWQPCGFDCKADLLDSKLATPAICIALTVAAPPLNKGSLSVGLLFSSFFSKMWRLGSLLFIYIYVGLVRVADNTRLWTHALEDSSFVSVGALSLPDSA